MPRLTTTVFLALSVFAMNLVGGLGQRVGGVGGRRSRCGNCDGRKQCVDELLHGGIPCQVLRAETMPLRKGLRRIARMNGIPTLRQFASDEHFEIRERGRIGAAVVAVGALDEAGEFVAERDA